MATLTLTVGASTDDAKLDNVGYADNETTMLVGATGTTNANRGQGWRFTGAAALVGATCNTAHLTLMKSGAQFQVHANRFTHINEDATATFSSGSPPGSRSIVTGIVAESTDVNDADGALISFPRDVNQRDEMAASLQEVVNRAGFNGTFAVVNQSGQDPSSQTNFSRKNFHSWDSSTASSEPTYTVDYTPAAGGQPFPPTPGQVHKQRIWTGLRM